MNAKTVKMIRKYTKLRGKNDFRINIKTLSTVFRNASPSWQEVFKKEMKEYFEAVESGQIEPGQSILSVVASPDNINGDSSAQNERDTNKNS